MKTTTQSEIKITNQKEDHTMKNSRNAEHVFLTIVIFIFFSTMAFGQTNNDQNTFSKEPFKSVRSDVNKSNPVESIAFESSTSGSQYQTDSNYELRRKLDNKEIKKQAYQERSNHENLDEISVESLYNYPNPFEEKTLITYRVTGRGMVNLSIYYQGRMVTTLVNKLAEEGEFTIEFLAMKYPAGVYEAVLTVGRETRSTSMYKIR